MSDPIKAILDEVIAAHGGRISTHYDGCYRNHAACLAVLLKDVIEDREFDREALLANLSVALWRALEVTDVDALVTDQHAKKLLVDLMRAVRECLYGLYGGEGR